MVADTPHRLLKEKQRQERAVLILQTAEAVFAEKGYHETSMDEIAARVGVAKGTVYQHFASKEALVFALFERQLEAYQQMVEQVVSQDLSARAKLESILLQTYQGVLHKQMQLMWSLYESMDIRKGELEERLQVRKRVDRLVRSIEAILQEGKASGEFDPTISTSVMLITVLSLLSPRGYEWVLAREPLSPEELVRQVGRTYFQGIALQR